MSGGTGTSCLPIRVDLTGQRFERLTVTGYAGKANNGSSNWHCRCDCGQTRVVNSSNLKRGFSGSCGCLRKETSAAKVQTHGQARKRDRSPEYKAWSNMHTRCYNPRTIGYAEYGGKGIEVCERWHSFEHFLQDMGPKPSPKHSIDRWPNNDGNYEPGNCRWATAAQQARNKSNTRVVAFEGRQVPLADLCDRFGIAAPVVKRRLRAGWPLLDALTNPILNRNLARPA